MLVTNENVDAFEKVIDTISKCGLDMKNSCDVLKFAALQLERTAAIDVDALQEIVKDTREYLED